MYEITSICRGGGYRYCRTNPSHPKANSKGLYPLHRVLAENKLGRPLRDDEDVHHIDEDKANDSPSNLEVMTKAEHTKRHRSAASLVQASCSHCGHDFAIKRHVLRQRLERSRTGKLFCSRVCTLAVTAIAR